MVASEYCLAIKATSSLIERPLLAANSAASLNTWSTERVAKREVNASIGVSFLAGSFG